MTTLQDTTTYSYSTAAINAGWLTQEEFYLGKDAALLQAFEPGYSLGYHFLTFLMDDFEKTYNILFTRPLSSVETRGVPPWGSQYQINQNTLTYTYDTANRPTSISISGSGAFPLVYTFTY
jgi:hypothetical protein